MDDGSVWARIVGPDPRGDDDRWVMLLDPAGNEVLGVSDVRFGDVTVAMSAGIAPPLPDDMKARFSSWICTRAACTKGRRPGRSCSTISSAKAVVRQIPRAELILVYCFSIFTDLGIQLDILIRLCMLHCV